MDKKDILGVIIPLVIIIGAVTMWIIMMVDIIGW